MYAHNGRMIVSVSDVTRHLECPHLSSLDRMVALRRVVRPRGGDTAMTRPGAVPRTRPRT